MSVQENPPDAPRQRGLLGRIREGMSSIGNGVVWLFAEDPRIQKVLTPAFFDEFHREYLRMCKERREGVLDPNAQASFRDVMDVNGLAMQYRIFDALIAQYPHIKALPDDLSRKVRLQLLDHCGLLPGLA